MSARDRKREAREEKRARDYAEREPIRAHHRCFWTWRWGHVWRVTADYYDGRGYHRTERVCEVCGREWAT